VHFMHLSTIPVKGEEFTRHLEYGENQAQLLLTAVHRFYPDLDN